MYENVTRINKYVVIIVICMIIMVSGLVKNNIEFTKNVPEYNGVKISYNKEPFNVQIDFDNYLLYINENIFLDIKENVVSIFDNIF